MKLSIISVSLNLGKFLEDTILSVQNQSFKDLEHIVIDGGSTDNSVEILKKYPHVKWISEPDKGVPDAIRKGLKMASGQYIAQCAVSDMYADPKWLQEAVRWLDDGVDLVYGYSQQVTEDGKLGNITKIPFREDMNFFWLASYLNFPEGSLMASKKIWDECYIGDNEKMIDWQEFTLEFHKRNYKSVLIPMIANYGRIHKGQLGELWTKSGKYRKMHAVYEKEVRKQRIWTPEFTWYYIKFLFTKERITTKLGMYVTSLKSIRINNIFGKLWRHKEFIFWDFVFPLGFLVIMYLAFKRAQRVF